LSRLTSTFFLFLYCSSAHRDLHSFPTRRSSDLCDQLLDLVVPEVLDRVLDVSAVEHQPRVREVLATLKGDDDLTLGVGGDVDVGRGVGHGLFLVPVVGGRCLLSLVLDGGEGVVGERVVHSCLSFSIRRNRGLVGTRNRRGLRARRTRRRPSM